MSLTTMSRFGVTRFFWISLNRGPQGRRIQRKDLNVQRSAILRPSLVALSIILTTQLSLASGSPRLAFARGNGDDHSIGLYAIGHAQSVTGNCGGNESVGPTKVGDEEALGTNLWLIGSTLYGGGFSVEPSARTIEYAGTLSENGAFHFVSKADSRVFYNFQSSNNGKTITGSGTFEPQHNCIVSVHFERVELDTRGHHTIFQALRVTAYVPKPNAAAGSKAAAGSSTSVLRSSLCHIYTNAIAAIGPVETKPVCGGPPGSAIKVVIYNQRYGPYIALHFIPNPNSGAVRGAISTPIAGSGTTMSAQVPAGLCVSGSNSVWQVKIANATGELPGTVEGQFYVTGCP